MLFLHSLFVQRDMIRETAVIIAVTPVFVALLWKVGAGRQQNAHVSPRLEFALVIWMLIWVVLLEYL